MMKRIKLGERTLSTRKSLVEFVDYLQEKLQAVPEEYRDSAVISFTVEEDYESQYCEMSLSYEREETEEERRVREGVELNDRLVKEARERALYENLRKKYEK